VDAPHGSVSRRCPDTSLANKLYGYSPKVNWKDGVEEAVKWYIDYIESGGDVYE